MSILLRRIRRHRRVLIAALAFIAVWAALSSLRSAPQTVTVVAASRDLPAGSTITDADLTTTTVLADSVTAEISEPRNAIGRMLLSAIEAREPLSTTRLIDARAIPIGHSLVPLALSSPEVARLLRAGDEIEVVTQHGAAIPARLIGVDTSGSRSVVLVELPSDSATQLAHDASGDGVSVTLRGNEGGS